MAEEIRKLGFSFLPIPEELMLDESLSFGAKLLFGIIAKANKEEVEWSVKYLAKRMKCSERETRRRIKELRDRKLITIEPRAGKKNRYSINFILVQNIQKGNEQTPDQMVSPDHSSQGTPDHSGQPNIKEIYIKETSKEGVLTNTPAQNEVSVIRNYFIQKCQELKGFKPEMSFAKEGKLIKEKLKRYSVEQLKNLIDKFLNSEIGDRLGWTLSVCLSAPVINQWLAGKLEKKKKPYWNGFLLRKVFGKWQVLVDGEWKEFAGNEKEIIFK
jgi:DNA-binding Lrp family transcriptional regulator